jgi:hypothetical protein
MFDGSAEPIQRVGVSDAAPTVRLAVTTIEPVALTTEQFGNPLNGTEKLNVPGVTIVSTVPETVKTLPIQAAVNPEGNPVAVPMPVAPVVAYKIDCIVPPKQTVWVVGADEDCTSIV